MKRRKRQAIPAGHAQEQEHILKILLKDVSKICQWFYPRETVKATPHQLRESDGDVGSGAAK